jgi:uncharacterized protein with NAD-binding domain and iron-sulfur cluster
MASKEHDEARLTLAGDYTKQEYLATMEGAVVSGRRAARLSVKLNAPAANPSLSSDEWPRPQRPASARACAPSLTLCVWN